jgi:hypothetical protein
MPNDVDVVILPGKSRPEQALEALESAQRWPFIHIQVAVDENDLEQWAREDFGTDRAGHKRGIVEINL